MAATDIPHADALLLCAIRKTADAAEWLHLATRGSMGLPMGVICEPPRRGFSIELYAHKGYKVQRRTIDFGLWDNTSGIAERVYQLTIADANSPTHKERGVQWYGSHEHMGDVPTQLPHMNAASFEHALDLFCARIHLQIEGAIDDPFEFKLK